MPNRIEQLRQTLADLEAELKEVDSLDPESRRLLQQAAGEIQEALAKSAPEDIEPHTWNEQLSEYARQFEQSHPTLSRLVQGVVDGLAQLGI